MAIRHWSSSSDSAANASRRTQGLTRAVAGLAAGALALVALSSTSVSGASSSKATGATRSSAGGGTLTIADLAPFSGTDAALGPIYLASCLGATKAINDAGGVLGHQLGCKAVDTRGDPADAVPATRQMFATTSNIVLVIGVTSDEAATVVPIINSQHMVVFAMTGQSEFDHTKFPYFFRLVPPDLEEAYALLAIAHNYEHFTRIALAFGNDIGSQTFVAPAIAAIHKTGLKLVANETLDLSATTFRTEAEKIVLAHPQVILTEALGPSEATFLSEVKQLNGGKMIPTVGTSATIDPAWYKSVSGAVGASTLTREFLADNLVTQVSGAAYQSFEKTMEAVRSQIPGGSGNFSTFLTAPGAVHLYDGMNLAALAMVMSNSTNPSVYRADIIKIGDGVRGATVVNSFAAGVALLKKHKAIRFIGPGGPTSFDAYHDSAGLFQIDRYSTNGTVQIVANLPNAEVKAYA